jgi:hypothetical protein
MKSLVVMLMLVVLAAGAPAQPKSKAATKEKDYSGYVVDRSCATGMMKKPDPMEKAAAHTRDCALAKACAASGYGLFTGGKWYAFDKEGSAMAKSMLENSKREDHMYAAVTGSMQGKTIVVKSIKEADPPKH